MRPPERCSLRRVITTFEMVVVQYSDATSVELQARQAAGQVATWYEIRSNGAGDFTSDHHLPGGTVLDGNEYNVLACFYDSSDLLWRRYIDTRQRKRPRVWGLRGLSIRITGFSSYDVGFPLSTHFRFRTRRIIAQSRFRLAMN